MIKQMEKNIIIFKISSNDLVQGSLDITTYYTRMKILWKQLKTLSVKSQCNCNCTCGAKESMHKAEQDRRLIQFLMGLNGGYIIVRESILMMKPLPSMAQAFSLLIQEEKQREFNPNSQVNLDSTSLHVNANSQHQSPFGARNFKTHYTNNNNIKGRPFCDYCKRPRHTGRSATSFMDTLKSITTISTSIVPMHSHTIRGTTRTTSLINERGLWQMYMGLQLI